MPVRKKQLIARPGGLRRKLGIPNPISYFFLADTISKNWKEIELFTNQSNISLSTPIQKSGNSRAISPRCDIRHLPYHRISQQTTAKYIVRTDISNFYHSIYTHSIPWALHSKPIAKKNRKSDLLGNMLDRAVQALQDNQTIGIPIGPDTSLIIAEILLTDIDCELQKKLNLTGFRFFDDFEFVAETKDYAEKILSYLDTLLDSYELRLNPKKTVILELPVPSEDTWASELRFFPFNNTKIRQESVLRRYFDRAIELHKMNPDKYVLKYAAARLKSIKVDQSCWDTYQKLMIQIAISEPGSFEIVAKQFIKYCEDGFKANIELLNQAVHSIIDYHSCYNHSSEVAWAIWIALLFRIKLKNETTSKILEMEDSVTMLMVLHAVKENLISESVNIPEWCNFTTSDDLFEEHWLLAYEINSNKMFSSLGLSNITKYDPCFKYLIDHQVTFYDFKAIDRFKKASVKELEFDWYY